MNNSKGSLYIEKLGEEYSKHGFSREWNQLMNIKVGITDIEKKKLIEIFPNIPKSLLDILSIVDGTYYREYKNEEVLYYFFGSDVDNGEYPYYLFSYEDIIKNKDNAKYFSEFFIYSAITSCKYVHSENSFLRYITLIIFSKSIASKTVRRLFMYSSAISSK